MSKRAWKPNAMRGASAIVGYGIWLDAAARLFYRHYPRKGRFYHDVHSCVVAARKTWLDKRAWEAMLDSYRSAR